MQLRYYICGQGVLRSEIEEYAKSRGVLDSVVFLGYRRDIPRICSCADVFLHTSYQEGLPVAVMEAMACGTPIVASRIRGNVDLIEDGVNGFLADAQDATGYVEGIVKLLDDPALAEEFRANGLKKIKHYDMQIVTEQLKKIYCNTNTPVNTDPAQV
jgi:glycosyltransferase EpsD